MSCRGRQQGKGLLYVYKKAVACSLGKGYRGSCAASCKKHKDQTLPSSRLLFCRNQCSKQWKYSRSSCCSQSSLLASTGRGRSLVSSLGAGTSESPVSFVTPTLLNGQVGEHRPFCYHLMPLTRCRRKTSTYSPIRPQEASAGGTSLSAIQSKSPAVFPALPCLWEMERAEMAAAVSSWLW